MLFFKSIKKAMLLVNAMFVVIGVYLIIYKEKGLSVVYTILASGLCLTGLLSIVRYFLIDIKERIKREDFLVGSLLIAIGVVLYLSRVQMSYLTFVIFGICMLISSMNKIQDMFDLKACGKGKGGVYLLLFIIGVGIGILCMNSPFITIELNYIVTGVGLIFSGITDFISNVYLALVLYKFDKKNNEKIRESEKDSLAEDIQNENIIEQTQELDETDRSME